MAKDNEAMKVVGNVVVTTMAVKRNVNAPEHILQVELDFTGVSQEQLLIWAARSRKIDMQRPLRACSEDLLCKLEKKLIKRLATEAGLAFTAPDKSLATAKAAAKQLTAEQRAELIATLQAMND